MQGKAIGFENGSTMQLHPEMKRISQIILILVKGSTIHNEAGIVTVILLPVLKLISFRYSNIKREAANGETLYPHWAGDVTPKESSPFIGIGDTEKAQQYDSKNMALFEVQHSAAGPTQINKITIINYSSYSLKVK